MSFWVFLDQKLEKNDYNVWNQHPRIWRNVKNCVKQTKSNLGPKMPYLGILGCKFEKALLIFLAS